MGCNRDYYRDVTTLRNPQYNDVKISKIMIFVPVKDIALQKATEKWFVEEFSNNGIKAVESYTIFSPLKSYSQQEMADIFTKNAIDAYMVVKYNYISSNSYYNGYTTDYGWTTGSVSTTLNYFTDTKLFLVNVADPIWEAQYTLYNYKSSDYDDIGYYLAWEIVGVYVRDFKKTEHKQ